MYFGVAWMVSGTFSIFGIFFILGGSELLQGWFGAYFY